MRGTGQCRAGFSKEGVGLWHAEEVGKVVVEDKGPACREVLYMSLGTRWTQGTAGLSVLGLALFILLIQQKHNRLVLL